MLGDDDPRFAVFGTFGAKKEWLVEAAAVIQSESYRLGLQNDNDSIYYTFGVTYDMKPFKVALHGAYFRDRFTGAHGQTNVGQKTDSVLFMPSVTGSVPLGSAGSLSFLAEGMFVVGSADGNNLVDCNAAAAGFQRCNYDIFAWGAIAMIQANFGMVAPYVGIIYGSGDDDPTDDELNGFAPTDHREITLMTGTKWFGPFDTASSFGARDVANPARTTGLAGASTANQGGTEFRHTVGSPFSDRLGNAAHPGINTTYSNPGTLVIPVGVSIFPLRGHQVDLTYLYVQVIDSQLLEVAFNTANVNESIEHEVQLQYQWSPSPYFDVRLTGGMLIPGDGSKDVAATKDCNFTAAGIQPCQGEDLAFHGEARFRARF
jgi:hypothetical protein